MEKPSKVRLQQLSSVHARQHPVRVEENVDRLAAGQPRHFLGGQHLGYDALVAVAPHQLVARLQRKLSRDPVLNPAHKARLALSGIKLDFRRILDLDELSRRGVDVPDRMLNLLAVFRFPEFGDGSPLRKPLSGLQHLYAFPSRLKVDGVFLLLGDGHLLYDRVAHHDRVVEIPPVPREIRHEQIAADLQLAFFRTLRTKPRALKRTHELHESILTA